MKFPLKIDYFDKTILMDLKKNFEPRFCKPFGIDEYLWDEEDHTSNWEDPVDITDEGYKEVRQRIELFSANSGFVFNSVHNVQSNVPTENLLAIFKAIDDARK